MKTFLSWLYQVYAWLFLIPFAFLWSFLCGWLAMITAMLISQRFASQRVGGVWARVIGYLTPMFVSREGLEHIDPKQTYVVVCNHVSQYDILLVYGWLGIDLRWVMKQELRKLPGLGAGCEKVGHIFVDRSNPEAARAAINEALERIGDGVGILFFPEGTRSRDGRLQPFKKGAFRMAVEQGLPVLPLTLLGTGDILPKGTLFVTPGRAKIVVHEAINPAGHDARSLMEASRAAIASALPPELR
ncbi:MAG: lysophospholipid acyltransferase family protein [Xanthomonadales bacterium]|nr:lysophospholipid acyltransferase family protein [Xanthomonadales bacterium]